MLFKKMRHLSKLNSCEVCKLLGISKSMLYKLEEGKRNPSVNLVSKLANTYNCSVEEIFKALNNNSEDANK